MQHELDGLKKWAKVEALNNAPKEEREKKVAVIVMLSQMDIAILDAILHNAEVSSGKDEHDGFLIAAIHVALLEAAKASQAGIRAWLDKLKGHKNAKG